MAVVLFVGSSVVPQSVVILMLSVSVMLGAFFQWIASAKSRRQKLLRIVTLGASLGVGIFIIDTCMLDGWWSWLCYAI